MINHQFITAQSQSACHKVLLINSMCRGHAKLIRTIHTDDARSKPQKTIICFIYPIIISLGILYMHAQYVNPPRYLLRNKPRNLWESLLFQQGVNS